jgi:hypothetical protein
MADKTRKTTTLYERQDEWLKNKAEELSVDQAVLMRRAIDFYKDKGIKQDKVLKSMVEGEV